MRNSLDFSHVLCRVCIAIPWETWGREWGRLTKTRPISLGFSDGKTPENAGNPGVLEESGTPCGGTRNIESGRDFPAFFVVRLRGGGESGGGDSSPVCISYTIVVHLTDFSVVS